MKAAFIDRDGVINELVYYQEHGLVDSPSAVSQFKLLSGVGEAIRKLHEMGYKIVLASNQPGIAKGNMSDETFEKIRSKMTEDLTREGAFLDGEYYCFHHPESKVERLRINCDCRKPKPGLLLKAAQDMKLDLSRSWMIGDGLSDIKAGKQANCKTILLGRMKCELCHLMDAEDSRPEAIAPNLLAAAEYIFRDGG